MKSKVAQKVLTALVRMVMALAKDPEVAHREIRAEEMRRRAAQDKRLGLD